VLQSLAHGEKRLPKATNVTKDHRYSAYLV
jgi:hypothetical protein